MNLTNCEKQDIRTLIDKCKAHLSGNQKGMDGNKETKRDKIGRLIDGDEKDQAPLPVTFSELMTLEKILTNAN